MTDAKQPPKMKDMYISFAHEEKIQVGDFESVVPRVEIGAILEEEDRAEDAMKLIQDGVEAAFKDYAALMIAKVIQRRKKITISNDSPDFARELLIYFKNNP